MSKKPKIRLKSAERNIWYNFMLESIDLDLNNNTKIGNNNVGFHWFVGLCLLNRQTNNFPKIDIAKIQQTLPDGHWCKEMQPITDAYLYNQAHPKFKSKLEELANAIKDAWQIDKIDFSKLKFKNVAIFSNLIFPIDTDFSNSKFLKDVFFNDAIFLDTADFEGTEFHNENSSDKGTAKFRNTIFKKIVNFKKSIFWRYANFKGATFSGRTIFQQTTFKIHAPRFYDTNLSKEITWDNINWPKFPFIFWTLWQDILRIIHPDSVNTKYVNNIRENQNAYETLAYQMEKLGKYHDQHLFFRYEMRCRRRLEKYLIRSFYWLYEKLSDYGYGVGRAFIFWVAHIAIFSIFFMVLINDCWGYRDLEYWKNLSCSISISLSNATPFSFISFEKDSLMACKSKLADIDLVLISTIKVTQTVLGILFLFLFLLALRVRFRIK